MKVYHFSSDLDMAACFIYVNNKWLNKSYDELRQWILNMGLKHAATNDTYVSCGGVLVIYEEIDDGNAVIMHFYVDANVSGHNMEEDFTTHIVGGRDARV